METSLQTPTPQGSELPPKARSSSTINITLPKALKDESEVALEALAAETDVPMPLNRWVVRVYAAAWKTELEKFRRKVSP